MPPSRSPAYAVAVAALLAPRAAHAFDAEVSADTAAQAYSLRSPFGDPTIYRRRITQTLGLGVFNLVPEEKPGGPQIFVKMRMRFDVDFGVEPVERQASTDPSSRFVPGLREAPLDLMYGYVEGKNLFGGFFGFRVGRQYQTSSLGWWSFDGGLARLTAPFVHVEAYGGFEQRGGLPPPPARTDSVRRRLIRSPKGRVRKCSLSHWRFRPPPRRSERSTKRLALGADRIHCERFAQFPRRGKGALL